MSNTGLFPNASFAAELEKIRRGDFKQDKVITINCANPASFAKEGGGRGLFEIEGNGLFLMPRYMTDDLVITGMDNTTRIWVKLNHPDNPWIPLSYIAASFDPCAITGVFYRFWVFVEVGPGFAFLRVLRGLSFSSSGQTGGGSGGGETGFASQKT